jgi:glycosyltransferase involved in cell wall biosynthesis/cytochrome c-type biogenesis protein CcmH/NrfG
MTDARTARRHLKTARDAFKAGDMATGERHAREALSHDPEMESARRLLARILNRQERWADAMAEWRVLTQAVPAEAEYHFQTGRLTLRLGDTLAAVPILEEAIRLRPDHIRSRTTLAKAFERLDRWEEAAAIWRPLLQSDPNNEDAHAFLLRKQAVEAASRRRLAEKNARAETKDGGREKPAQAAPPAVMKKAPDTRAMQIALARALEQTGSPNAVQAWAEPLAKQPDHLEGLRALARHASQAKDWTQAAGLWHRVLAQTPDDLGAHVAKARALDHDKAPEAKAAWDELLAKQPDHLEALRALARHATQAKNWTQAASLWDRVLTQTPDDLGAHVAKARALDHAKDPEAKAAWDDLLAKQPDHLEALRALARHATQAKNWTQAASLWDRVLTQTPDDLGAHVAKARALDHDKAPEAKAAWDELLAKEPDHLEALRALARHATQQEDWPNAAAHWLRLAQRTPTDPFPWTQWARAEERRSSSLDPWEKIVGRFADHLEGRLLLARAARSDAAHHWRHLRRLRPAMVEPVLQLARLHLAAQDWAQAEEALLAVLELCSGHAEALASLATLHARLQRHEDCLATCRRWARAQPDDPRPLRMIARHMTAHAYSQEAREAAWEALLERVPDHAEALMTLARLRHSRRDWAGALSLWERLCRVRPQQAEAWRNHVRLLTQMDRPEDARRMLDAADTALRDIPDSLLQRAMIAQAARDLDRAETLLRRATHENPAEAAPWKALGLLRWASGDLSGALPPLRRARDISPNDPDITAALVDIARALDASGLDTARVWNAASDKPPSLRAPDLLFRRVTAIAAERGAPRDSAIRRLPHVVLVTSSLGAGGAERQLATTAVGLRARSDCVGDVTVLVRSLDPDQRHDFFLPPLQDAGVTVETYGVSSTAEPCDTLDETPDAALLSCFPDAMGPRLVRLYRLLRRLSPTVVHAWQDTTAVEAAAVAALVGTPRILMAARSLRPDSQRRLTPYLAPAYQTLLTLPWVRLTNNSRAGLKDYADWLGVPLSCPVTPNALDVDALRRTLDPTTSAALRDRLGIAPNTPVLGGIMRFTEEKRPLLWLNTMAEVARSLPHAHFVLLGDGPMRPQVEETCRNLGLEGRAHLVGNDRMVGPWYGMMDALLLTSRVEGCPNVLLEAQAMGLPVVAPAVGGAPETVDHGRTGWIVDAAADGLAERLAERLVYCLSDEDWRARAASAGPAFIERRHGLNSALDATLDAYTSPFLAGVSPVVLAQ